MASVQNPKALYLDTPLDKFGESFKQVASLYANNNWKLPLAFCGNEAGALISLLLLLWGPNSKALIEKYIDGENNILDLISNKSHLPKVFRKNGEGKEHKGNRLRDKIDEICKASLQITKEGYVTMEELFNKKHVLFYVCLTEMTETTQKVKKEVKGKIVEVSELVQKEVIRLISNVDKEYSKVAVADIILAAIADGNWLRTVSIPVGETMKKFKSNLKNTLPINDIYANIKKKLGDIISVDDFLIVLKRAVELEHNTERVFAESASQVKDFFKTLVL